MDFLRLTRRLTLSLALAAPLIAASQNHGRTIREGNRAYADERFADAEAQYLKVLDEVQNEPRALFNAGNAAYRQQRLNDAVERYQTAATVYTEESDRADAHYNAGTALLASEDFAGSIASFREALRLDPDHRDARYNLLYAMKKLEQQRQDQQEREQQEQQQEEDENEQQQDEQDQQQDDRDEETGDDTENQEDQSDQQEEQSGQTKGEDEQDGNDEHRDPSADNDEQDAESQPKQSTSGMTREEAERLLDALMKEEQRRQGEVREAEGTPRSSENEKDW